VTITTGCSAAWTSATTAMLLLVRGWRLPRLNALELAL
jgi:hypothetical protein